MQIAGRLEVERPHGLIDRAFGQRLPRPCARAPASRRRRSRPSRTSLRRRAFRACGRREPDQRVVAMPPRQLREADARAAVRGRNAHRTQHLVRAQRRLEQSLEEISRLHGALPVRADNVHLAIERHEARRQFRGRVRVGQATRRSSHDCGSPGGAICGIALRDQRRDIWRSPPSAPAPRAASSRRSRPCRSGSKCPSGPRMPLMSTSRVGWDKSHVQGGDQALPAGEQLCHRPCARQSRQGRVFERARLRIRRMLPVSPILAAARIMYPHVLERLQIEEKDIRGWKSRRAPCATPPPFLLRASAHLSFAPRALANRQGTGYSHIQNRASGAAQSRMRLLTGSGVTWTTIVLCPARSRWREPALPARPREIKSIDCHQGQGRARRAAGARGKDCAADPSARSPPLADAGASAAGHQHPSASLAGREGPFRRRPRRLRRRRDAAQARDAADMIEIDYEPLPVACFRTP